MPKDAFKRLGQWWLPACTQIASALSSTDGPDLAEAPEERCFLRSARERDQREAGAWLEEGLGNQGL